MAILTGTSKTRFPPFSDPNIGVGALIGAGQEAVLRFLGQVKSFENQYVEDGVSNVPGFSTLNKTYGQARQPSKRKILTQRAQGTVFVKKRLFSSLSSNFDARFMSEKEKLFIRASKKLFLRKTQELSFYESLSNIEKIFDDDGFLKIDRMTDGIVDSLIMLVERSFVSLSLDSIKSIEDIISTDSFLEPYAKALLQLLKLRKLNHRSKSQAFTTWIIDPDNSNDSGLGPGVGVIELNQVSSVSTNIGIDTGSGNATLSIEDPYKTMLISDLDIEIALRDAIADKASSRNSVDQLTSDLFARAKLLDNLLNERRRARGVSEINFQFILGAETPVGTVISTGEEFTFNDPTISAPNAFIGTEGIIAREILSILGAWHAAQKRTIGLFQIVNEKYNDVRQRLRNEFMGHSLIQQMDQVSIFMKASTRDVTPNQNGPSSFVDFFQNGLADQQGALDVSTIKLEHEELAPDVPFIFYLALRNRESFRGDGVQVFSGLVESINTSYQASNGVFNINVNCVDNMRFLELSKFMINPSMAQPKAMLYDPLTPFDLETDEATGLIKTTPELSEENKRRLKYLRFNDGIDAGEHATEKNIFQDKLVGGRVQSYQHVPGLVYKWKNGIIAETLNVNTKKPLSGEGPTIADVIDTFGVTTYQNPFGGLDAADVMSILITGRPHNYATFLKSAVGSGTFSVDNSGQTKSYFNFLFDFLERQDLVHGNFLPAISSPIDPVVATAAYRQKRKIEGLNSQLLKKLREKADLEDKIQASIGQTSNLGQLQSANKANIESEIYKTKKEIAALIRGTDDSTAGANVDPDHLGKVSFGVSGNDIYLSLDDRKDIEDLGKLMKYKLKKKSEDVRYNLDSNYFIVSELYTSDTDIQAIAQNLKKGNPELFNSDYESPLEQCKFAANSVGFEFFADSQGNLVFRPPEYNKTPLSLLLKLLALTKSEGVSYAPEFLQSLFSTRSEQVLGDIRLSELEILESLILLGEPINTKNKIKVVTQTSYNTGIVAIPGSEVVLSLEAFTNSDGAQDWSVDVGQLQKEVSKERVFSIDQQQALQSQSGAVQNESGGSIGSAPELLIQVRNAIKRTLGRDYETQDHTDFKAVVDAGKELRKFKVGADTNAYTNRLNVVNKIAQNISNRQRLGKVYFSIQKNINEFQIKEGAAKRTELAIPSSVSAQLKGMGVEPTFPKFMEYLIENDLSNEDGFNSGKRFIINDDVIISMSLSVQTPDFNMIQVTGNQDLLNTPAETGALGSIPYVFWAGAVDYDSWRRFGLRAGQNIHRADFIDAETQCAPYAVFKLQEQRKNIHRGSITILGNEFYQAGDVVYLNNRSMLYYVTQVSHTFDFDSGNFQTTLELGYGRALGEYIPTPLDIIGKGLLSNDRKQNGRVKANRTSVSANHTVDLSTIYFSQYNFLNSNNMTEAQEAFVSNKANQKLVNNAIRKAESRINKDLGDSRIEVRTYYISTEFEEDTALLISRATWLGNWVKEMLIHPVKDENDNKIAIQSTPKFNSNNVVQISPINISPDYEPSSKEKKLRRFPSAQAWAGENPFVAQDGIGLPLNAIDIVFVSEKTQYGNVPPVTLDNSDVIL